VRYEKRDSNVRSKTRFDEKKITSIEADDLIKTAMRNRVFRVPLEQKKTECTFALTAWIWTGV
jgi:hypothetical protein